MIDIVSNYLNAQKKSILEFGNIQTTNFNLEPNKINLVNTSVSRITAGQYQINFQTPMSDANYCVSVGVSYSSGLTNYTMSSQVYDLTINSFKIASKLDVAAYYDYMYYAVQVFGD
jgi:hypothetical protein